MKIFDKRPLSLILCILLAAFVFFANTNKEYAIFAAAFALLLFIFSFIVPKLFRGKLYAIRISALLIIPTVFLSVVYFNYYFKADMRFKDQKVTVDGYVYEIDKAHSTTSDLAIIKSENINGEPMTKYTLVAYFSKEESQEMTTGAQLTVTGKLTSFSRPDSSWYGKGYSAIIDDITECSVTGYREPTLSNIVSNYRSSLARYVVLKSEDTYSGGLFAALLLGEQDYLEPGLKNEFKMIGISHILALSGMHLAIICLGLGSLLAVFGVNKKLRTVIVIIFTLLYMAFTGFSSSVTRSGIMLIVSSLLYLLSRTHDSVTSLFLSVALICLVEPYAIFDISLWLSAFATLGVLTAYDGFNEYDKKKPLVIRFLRYILMSLLSSLFAISATLLLSDIYFGRTSIIAPITTLVFGVLCELYMYLGIVTLILTLFFNGFKILSPLYEIISNLSDFLSDINYVYTYTTFTAVEIMILILSFTLILFLILNVRKRSIAAFILCGMLLSIYTTSYFMTKYYLSNDVLIYHSEKNSDTFICKSNNKIAVVDSRIYSINQAYKSEALFEKFAICEIDTYILPVYYWRMTEMISSLLSTTKIERIAIPSPKSDIEDDILENVRVVCEEHKTKLKILENDERISVGDFSFFPIFRTPNGTETQSYVYTMLLNDKFCTYISSGFLDTVYKGQAEKALLGSDTIILGEHGKKYTDSYIFKYPVTGLKNLIFNSDNAGLNEYYTEFYSSNGTNVIYDVTDLHLLKD